MKIEPKKCPTCGGNLKFEYGEENASCPYCKREYIIEYESPNYTDLIHLKEYYAKLAKDAHEGLETVYDDFYMCSEREIENIEKEREKISQKIAEYDKKANYFERVIDVLSSKEILKNKL